MMVGTKQALLRSLLPAAMGVLLVGCAQTPLGPTVQVMPGPGKSFDAFQTDSATCKGFAASQVRGQAEAVNQQAVGAAALTTVLGAGLGAVGGSIGGNAGAGAAIGAAAGAGTGGAFGAAGTANAQMGIQAQYDNAFAQCMYSKGDQVPGYAPPMAAMPQSYSGPDPALVRAVQTELIRLRYLNGGADGAAGPQTRAAIRAYENSTGLPVDGAVSPDLLAKLQATPANGSAGWVPPAGSGPAPAVATAPAPGGWVAPTGGATPASASAPAPAAPSGWVAPKTP